MVEAAGHDRNLGAEPALDLVGDREGEQEIRSAGVDMLGHRQDRAEVVRRMAQTARRQERVEQVGIAHQHRVEECGLIHRGPSATDERRGGTPAELLGVCADGSMRSPSSAPTAQAMLSSTFRFSVRMAPGSISAVVAPTDEIGDLVHNVLVVMFCPFGSTTVESSQGRRRPRPNAYL